MKDETEVQSQSDDDWADDDIEISEKGRTRSGVRKLLPVLVGILIVLALAAGVYYFTARHSSGSDANLMQMKMAAFEQKISSLERQIGDLQGKLGPAAPDPALLQRIEALAHKVEALEKRPQPKVEALEKRPQPPTTTEATPASHKAAVTTDKRYHTVRKGETLYKISKAYGISVETLRKLNNLSANQGPRTGQKLLVSPGR